MNEIDLGQIVFSKSGRDKGKYYLVVKILDQSYCLIADGDIRKIEKPKKKKLMHLKATKTILPNIKEKLLQGKIVHNKELISALKALERNGEGEVNV